MISFINKRKKYFLSKIFIGSFISVLCFVLTCAVTVQGVSPDITGTPLPEGYQGYYAETYWNGDIWFLNYHQSGLVSMTSYTPSWSNSSNPFYNYIPEDTNTSELFAQLGTYRQCYRAVYSSSSSEQYTTVSVRVQFKNTIIIPAGMQCEFWAKLNNFDIMGVAELVNGTIDNDYAYTAKRFINAMNDQWASNDPSNNVLFEPITTETDGRWICYRSDISDHDRTITGIWLFTPTGDAKKVYGTSDVRMSITFNASFSGLLVGYLDYYPDSPPSPPADQDQIDDIINGTPDMDPDVSTPNYNEITPNPDYDVGGLVGEDDAISNLENMQGAANDLVGSSSFVQASNFWQDVFAKIFNLAGASVMASISGAIIVIRAVIGR